MLLLACSVTHWWLLWVADWLDGVWLQCCSRLGLATKLSTLSNSYATSLPLPNVISEIIHMWMISGNISITLLIKNDVISIFTQVVMPYDINLGSRNHRAYVSQSITSVLRKIGLICTRHISWWYHHAAIPCFYDRHYPLKPSVFKMQQEVHLDLLLHAVSVSGK